MLFYQSIEKVYSTFVSNNNIKEKLQRRYYAHQVCLVFIFIILFILTLIKFFLTTKNSDTLEIYDVYKSTFILSNESFVLNIHNHSIHRIYIDIGCFNGETIEHFIHFTPNSSLYDIITFEPDPTNYQLCKQRLTQQKYRNYNIIIIPKVVWIRNEKVAYQTNLGDRSRIDQSKKNKSNFPKLDAIDFSSWLSHLIKRNHTEVHIKISMPEGMEVKLLQKMIADDTFSLITTFTINWTDRSNLRRRPSRYYVVSMFDSLGYDFLYFTQLPDLRKVFQINGTHVSVKKYRSLDNLDISDTYSHYAQRPDVINPPRIRKTNVILKKI